MCNRYEPSSREKVSMKFAVGAPVGEYKPAVGPQSMAPIVVSDRAIVAQWGLIPPWSKTRQPRTSTGKRMSTNNCRRETIATAPTFNAAWRKGRRCIIPADSFDEPYWGTKEKNIWWRFWRADGEPWALAGIWSEWTDCQTGEVVPSFTLITQNCDDHPLLALMHRPERDKTTGEVLPADQQDKRTVVSLEPGQYEQWLLGSPAQAEALIKVPELQLFRHGAADPAQQVVLPI